MRCFAMEAKPVKLPPDRRFREAREFGELS
jgi:hypothetical protein